MSIQRYAQGAYFATIEGGLNLGGFSFPKDCELANVRAFLFLASSLPRDTRLTMRLCADAAGERILSTSDELRLGNTPDWTDGMGWLGWLRFDFPKKNLIAGNTYYFNLKPGDTYVETSSNYVGVRLDDNPTVYSTPYNRAFQVAFFVKEFA